MQILPHRLVSGTRPNFNDNSKLPIQVADVKNKDGSFSPTDTSKDSEIQIYIRTVIQYFEDTYKYYIIQQDRELFIDTFPDNQIVPINARNVVTIKQIAYYPLEWNKLDARTPLVVYDDYLIRQEVEIYTSGVIFQRTHSLFHTPQNIRILFEAGFEYSYANFPFDLRDALLQHIIRFTNRLKGDDCEDCETLTTPAIRKIYEKYSNKIHWNYGGE